MIRRALLAVPLLGLPLSVHAQSFANGWVYQFTDQPNPYVNTIQPGCFSSGSGSGAVSASVAGCSVAANAGGGGTAVGSSMSSFDPATGTFKSGASLSASAYTLSQFVPTYDAMGNRVYSGLARPDVVGVYGYAFDVDMFSLATTPGTMPATISFFLDLNGTLQADALPGGATTFASSFINFCTAAVGVCNSDPANSFNGIAGTSLNSNGGYGFSAYSNAPPGANPASIDFVGTYTPTSVNGRLTLSNIPILAGSPYDFWFVLGTTVAMYHPSASYGNLPDGCDPTLDPNCVVLPSVDVTGDAVADFTHTVTFAGYQVLDANGNDITRGSQLTFASGLTPAAIATPEPATLALVGGGLLALGAAVRHRRTA